MVDLATLRLAPGDVRRVDVAVHLEPLLFGGQTYVVEPPEPEAHVELQATAGGLYLKLAFEAAVVGPCYRCLEDARARVRVRASEYQARGAEAQTEEMVSDYLDDDQLDIDRWARDAIVLALPAKILCRPDCAGLCPRCGERLEDGVEHACGESEPDHRWDALRQLLE